MVIIWGEKLYGKVDRINGVAYVATRFFHLWYFPLVPLTSFIVIAGTESEDGFQGVEIKIDTKSVLFGYLRGVLVTISILFGILFGVTLLGLNSSTPISEVVFLGLAFIGPLSGLLVSYQLDKPSLTKAQQIMRRIGYTV